jgi:hypothetical protein
MEAQGGLCYGSSALLAPTSYYSGAASIPHDCYIKGVVGAWGPLGNLQEQDLILHASSDFNTDYLDFYVVDNGDGITTSLNVTDSVGTYYTNPTAATPQVGDVMVLATVGGKVYASYNGVFLVNGATSLGGFLAGGLNVLTMLGSYPTNVYAAWSHIEIGSASSGAIIMAATNYAMLGSFNGVGATKALAYGNAFGPSSNSIDVMQIIDANGNILLNVDSAGVVHNPASSATTDDSGLPKTRLGAFRTHLTGSPTTANLFADAFTNPSNQDIIQITSPNGASVSYYIDYQGVSH